MVKGKYKYIYVINSFTIPLEKEVLEDKDVIVIRFVIGLFVSWKMLRIVK